MKRRPYAQVYDGDWIEPWPQRGHRMKCCDCGLVHVMNFRVRDGRVQFQAFRHDRATSASRRKRRPAIKGVGKR